MQIRSIWLYGLAVAAVALSTAGTAFAGFTPAVPEIDGNSITAGLGLLAAGVLILRARRGSK